MDTHYKEALESQLMEEIDRIGRHVMALGAPVRTEERSVIARYGKLLLVSQQLLDVVGKLQWEGASYTGPLEPEHPVTAPGAGRTFSRQLGVS